MSNNIKFNNISIDEHGKIRLSEREITNIVASFLISKGIPVKEVDYNFGFAERDIGPVLKQAVVDVDVESLQKGHSWIRL